MTTNTDPVRALIEKWRNSAENGVFTGGAGPDIRETLMECAGDLEAALASAPPSATVGVEGLLKRMEVQAANLRRAAATNREAGESIHAILDAGHQYEPDDPVGLADGLISDADDGEALAALLDETRAALAQQPPVAPAAEFRNDGGSEAEFIAHHADACTACGGSGHKAPQQPAAVDAYSAGWRQCAKWAGREDLIADIDSPAYEADRAAALAAQQQGGRADGFAANRQEGE